LIRQLCKRKKSFVFARIDFCCILNHCFLQIKTKSLHTEIKIMWPIDSSQIKIMVKFEHCSDKCMVFKCDYWNNRPGVDFTKQFTAYAWNLHSVPILFAQIYFNLASSICGLRSTYCIFSQIWVHSKLYAVTPNFIIYQFYSVLVGYNKCIFWINCRITSNLHLLNAHGSNESIFMSAKPRWFIPCWFYTCSSLSWPFVVALT
jgi:hypothetical protein